MTVTNHAADNESKPESRIVSTSGELFDDGSAIELVAAQHGRNPDLLLWRGETAIIAPEVTHHGTIYRPVELDERVWSATRLPARAGDYGTAAELFADTVELFQEYVGFPRRAAELATAWTASTWLSDCLPSPPPLMLSGPDMDQAVSVFGLFSSLNRRPVPLAEVTRSAVYSLSALNPTLLINAPHLSPSIRRFCESSNYGGVFVLAKGGFLSSVPCSKIFFVGAQTGHDWWSGTAVYLSLPINPAFPPLDARKQAEIAEHYQPRWLRFRLDRFLEVKTSKIVTERRIPMHSAVTQLQACVQGQAELCGELAGMIRAQEEDARARSFLDPSTAIVEVLWPLFHSSEKPKTVGQLTDFLNTVLLARGGTRQYDAAEIGTLLSNLSVGRRRKNDGVYLTMDPDSNRQVHRLATAYGLGKSVSGCAYCRGAGIEDEQAADAGENNAD